MEAGVPNPPRASVCSPCPLCSPGKTDTQHEGGNDWLSPRLALRLKQEEARAPLWLQVVPGRLLAEQGSNSVSKVGWDSPATVGGACEDQSADRASPGDRSESWCLSRPLNLGPGPQSPIDGEVCLDWRESGHGTISLLLRALWKVRLLGPVSCSGSSISQPPPHPPVSSPPPQVMEQASALMRPPQGLAVNGPSM